MVSVKKRVLILAVLVFLIVAGFLGWRWLQRKHAPSDTITLYGNVDIRQVQLAFNDSERIDKLLVDEGSAIHADQLIAQLVCMDGAAFIYQQLVNALTIIESQLYLTNVYIAIERDGIAGSMFPLEPAPPKEARNNKKTQNGQN